MIKKFYIFENSLYSDLNTLYSKLKDEQVDDNEIINLIGLDTTKYRMTINDSSWKNYDFTLSFKEKFLTQFLGLEDEIFKWCLGVMSPYGYESYVDDSEMDVIDNYLNEDNSYKLKLLLTYLDIDIEDQVTSDVFDVLGEDLINTDYLKDEISNQWTKAVKHNVKESLEEIPFKISISSFSGWDIDFDIDIEKIGEYIEKYKLDVNTIKEFLENIDFSVLSSDLNNHYETSYDFDYKGLNNIFEEYIDNILEKLDIQLKFDDPKQLKLFGEEEYSKLIRDRKYDFDNELFRNLDIENINSAKRAGGKLLAWFKSYLFQKKYMKGDDAEAVEKYNKLKKEEIIHPDIEEEYEYLDAAAKFNV